MVATRTIVLTLPRFGALAAALSVEVQVDPLRQAFDCARRATVVSPLFLG